MPLEDGEYELMGYCQNEVLLIRFIKRSFAD